MSRLERASRRIQIALFLTLAAAASALAAAWVFGPWLALFAVIIGGGVLLAINSRNGMATEPVVRARKFEVIGEDGQVLIELGETIEGKGVIATRDGSGVSDTLGATAGEQEPAEGLGFVDVPEPADDAEPADPAHLVPEATESPQAEELTLDQSGAEASADPEAGRKFAVDPAAIEVSYLGDRGYRVDVKDGDPLGPSYEFDEKTQKLTVKRFKGIGRPNGAVGGSGG